MICKWIQFIRERFNPLAYGVMLFSFLGAHYALSLDYLNGKNLIPLIVAISLFFFKLRLLDEVKDIESDILYYPKRPLPRGLLTRDTVVRAAFSIMVAEIILLSYYGFYSLLAAIVVVIYSLIMYKEFFISKWLRSHLIIYAVTHTFIVVLISIAIFLSLLDFSLFELPPHFIYFSLAGWFLFNIFEFGRKTFALIEERSGIDSYSKMLGKFGAVLLVLVMATIANILLIKGDIFNVFIFSPLFLLIVIGFLYSIKEKLYFAKFYRLLAFLYIALIYIIVIFSQYDILNMYYL
jgi:hypothetical protein